MMRMVRQLEGLREVVGQVSWCFGPSQQHGILPEWKTNFNPSPSYSFQKSLNIAHKILQLSFKTLHTNITPSRLIFYRTHQSLWSQNLLSESHFGKVKEQPQ